MTPEIGGDGGFSARAKRSPARARLGRDLAHRPVPAGRCLAGAAPL